MKDNNCSGKFTEILKREGVKNTKQRSAILEILENAKRPLTAENIFILLKDNGVSVNLSTVYRTLETLYSKGLILKSNIMDDGRARYELNHHKHRHHLYCLSCNRIISVEDCPIGEFEKALQEKIGFDVTSHKLEIYGYCHDCKRGN